MKASGKEGGRGRERERETRKKAVLFRVRVCVLCLKNSTLIYESYGLSLSTLPTLQ